MSENSIFPSGRDTFLKDLEQYLHSIYREPITAHFSLDSDWGQTIPTFHFDGETLFKIEDTLDTELEKAEPGFTDTLFRFISSRGMTNAEVYTAAGIDRRHFSKLISGEDKHPQKDTLIALALALQLELAEAKELLGTAGYIFSHSDRRDIIIEFFFRERIYNKFTLNEILEEKDEKPLKY